MKNENRISTNVCKTISCRANFTLKIDQFPKLKTRFYNNSKEGPAEAFVAQTCAHSGSGSRKTDVRKIPQVPVIVNGHETIPTCRCQSCPGLRAIVLWSLWVMSLGCALVYSAAVKEQCALLPTGCPSEPR